MTKHPWFLRLWGVGIAALGLWHIVSWLRDVNPNKDSFSLAVGLFCVVIGVTVLIFTAVTNGSRKGN